MTAEIYGTSPITSGRAVIPKKARLYLGVGNGDRVVFAKMQDYVIIIPSINKDGHNIPPHLEMLQQQPEA